MEENNHHEHHPNRHAWRWIAGFIIIIAAFGIGFACGRFSAFFDGYGFGYRLGYPMGPWMMYSDYGYPYGQYYAAPQTETVPPGAASGGATTTPSPYYYPMWRMMGGYYYPQATSTP